MAGLEPATSAMSRQRSSKLSYTPSVAVVTSLDVVCGESGETHRVSLQSVPSIHETPGQVFAFNRIRGFPSTQTAQKANGPSNRLQGPL